MWLERMFAQILDMSMTAGICITVILLIRLIFHKAPRKYLYVLWLAAAFRLVCPVSVESGLSLFNLTVFPAGIQGDETGAAGVMAELAGLPAGTEGILEEHAGRPAESDGSTEDAAEGSDFSDVLSVGTAMGEGQIQTEMPAVSGMRTAIRAGSRIWVAGMLVFLVYFLYSWRKIRREVQMAYRTEDGVYECEGLSSPFVLGVFCPRIYVPCGMDPGQRELAVLHERCHLRRKDHLVKLLSFVLLGVYWFHPLVWIGWRCMCRDMEMSCDERALEYLGAERRTEYSRTLLALGTEGGSGSRLPLAFGENDVEKRIRHALSFRKPALWMGAGAVLLILAALLFLGTNGRKPEEAAEVEEEQTWSQAAEGLYENRNPYVGDAPANGRLIGAVGEALPNSPVNRLAFHSELQTSEEPYEFRFMLEENPEEEDVTYMVQTSALMLALTDNLGEVQWWRYRQPEEGGSYLLWSWDTEEIETRYAIPDLKACGNSPESVQELLDLLAKAETLPESSAAGEMPSEGFMQWYSSLPAEMYEEARSFYQTSQEGDYMVELARTEDGTVTVYGLHSEEHGPRGITVDWKITPDGDSNHTYFDWYWNWNYGNYQVYVKDYDGDGRDEIALEIMQGSGTGVSIEQLAILETWDTGHLEAYIFELPDQQAEWTRQIDWSLDEENNLVQVIRRDSEDSAPVLSLPYGDMMEEGGAAKGIGIGGQVHFLIGEEIRVYYAVAVIMEEFATPQYTSEEELSFRVVYHGPDAGQDQMFELTDLGTNVRAQ